VVVASGISAFTASAFANGVLFATSDDLAIYSFDASTGFTRDVSIAGLQHGLTGLAPAFTAVPEPATWLLVIAGFGMLGFASRERSRRGS
jgi:PEP-CTERM motif